MTLNNIRELFIEKFPSICRVSLDKYLTICYDTNQSNEYTELHHILPKSIWPEYLDFSQFKWNCANLSGYNHFIAHYWIAKATNNSNLWWAIHCMSNMKHRLKDCTIDDLNTIALLYEDAKGNFSHSEKTRNKIRNSLLGSELSEERKEKISNALIGKEVSIETRDKMRLSKYGTILSDKTKHKIGAISSSIQRKGEIWNPPLYDVLWNAWNTASHPKYVKFATYLRNNGIYDTKPSSLLKLVKHFNSVLLNHDSIN